MGSIKENNITEIKWYVPLELNHSSYIYTSLIEYCNTEHIPFKISSRNLNKRGSLIVKNDTSKATNEFNAKITWVHIKFLKEEDKLIAFDLSDNPNCFGIKALNKADFYYKRCHQEKIIKVLPNEYKVKIKSLGLPFMVRPNAFQHLRKLTVFFYLFKITEIFKFDRLLFKRLQLFNIKAIQHFKGFNRTRKVLDFNKVNSNVLGNIFYQKRLFDESSEDIKGLNKQRVRIISLLKDNFSEIYFGGLQSNEISKQKYPNLISNINGNQHAFLEAMRKCGICIYTNGLKGSPGWTLPEFLSQGKCIVAQKLENELPYPLINNKHLVFYSSENELIAICEELIKNSEKRKYLGRNARKYYEKFVDPRILMSNIIKENFE